MPGTSKLVCSRLCSKNAASHGFEGGRPPFITQPPLVFKNNICHKTTLILCCSNMQHHGMQKPSESQNIHNFMINNQLVLLLVVEM